MNDQTPPLDEGFVQVPTTDGSMECFVARPRSAGPFPPVILYMDAPGVRDELYEFVRRIARHGYFAVIPNLYYRYGVREAGGRMMELLQAHTNAMIVHDTGSLIAWLDAQPAATPGPMGCIGYCMSGKFVLAVTGAFPERFKAMASLYGVSHVTQQPDSAHLLIPRILPDCSLYFGFAEHDPFVPDAEIAALADALKRHGADYVLEKIPDTHHGFAFPERMGYHHEAAERHWDIAFELFDRKLKAT
ncbi:MAG: dienelactone hydrolase family protein [Porticoccaceae bacterium]